MDYRRIYSEFITDRKAKPKPQGYTERHHIVPRSLGGGDEPDNLIDLTAEDHFFAHLLLAKAYGGRQWAALIIMLKPARQVGIVSRGKRVRRIVAIARQRNAEFQKGKSRPGVSAALKGRKFSAETRQKISAAATGRRDTTETRAEKSRASTGRVFSAERNAKVAASKIGEQNPAKRPEVRAKIAAKANNGGVNNPRHNKLVRSFIHADGRIERLTKFEMAERHGLNRTCLNYVINGVRPETRGWRLYDESRTGDCIYNSVCVDA